MTDIDRAAYDRLREENERLKRGEKALQDAIVGIGRQWADESEAAEQQVAALREALIELMMEAGYYRTDDMGSYREPLHRALVEAAKVITATEPPAALALPAKKEE